ncbi:SwmB domain-containing protein [Azospirillum sp. ST 5-10]|uniref:SwmB domain-containing protein n=1 Tax=unclassified Azospirillum TaxID=2630922 RepID=UPI003F49D194
MARYIKYYTNSSDPASAVDVFNGSHGTLTDISSFIPTGAFVYLNSAGSIYNISINVTDDSWNLLSTSGGTPLSPSTAGLLIDFSGQTEVMQLDGGSLGDWFIGGSSQDTMNGGGGADTLSGGSQNDSLMGGDGNDDVDGNDGNDTANGGNGNDTLKGGAGNDTVIGGSGTDLIEAGDGNDVIYIESSSDHDVDETINGGDGSDFIRFKGAADGDTLVLNANLTDPQNTISIGIAGNAGGSSSSAQVNVDASAITLSVGAQINGSNGDNQLTGSNFADTLNGGNGTDTLIGGAGNDIFTGDAAQLDSDVISDFAAGDSIVVTSLDLSSLNNQAASGTIDLGSSQTLTLTGVTAASGTWSAVYSGGSTTLTFAETIPPVFQSASVTGTKLVLTYDEALDGSSTPDASHFQVSADGTSIGVSSSAVDGPNKTVTLTLDTAVAVGQAVTVAYTDATGDQTSGVIQDSVGNDAASLTATTVTNNTPTIDILSNSTNVPLPFIGYVGQTFTATGTKLESAAFEIQLPLLPVVSSYRLLLTEISNAGGEINPTTVLFESGTLAPDLTVLGPQRFDVSINYDGLTVGSEYAIILDGVVETTPLGLIYFDTPDVYSGGIQINGAHTNGNTRTQDFAANWTENAGSDLAVQITMSGVPPVPQPPAPSSPDVSSPATPTPEIVDGVPVQTSTTTNGDGTTTQTVTIPVVTTARPEQVGNNTVADIPLVTSGGTNLLTAQVPTGYGMTASGSAAPKAAGNSLADLIREIEAHTEAGSEDQTALTGGGAGFLSAIPADTPLLVQTIVPTAASGSTVSPESLVITGSPTAAGNPYTALVIDTRSLPSGTVIQLQDVEFAAVIGAVRVTGGAGSQTVWGDSAAQYMVLGAEDDTLRGGAGNDFVGSAAGNDVLFGDEGDDTVTGGLENDALYGNKQNDLLYGNFGNDTLFGGQDSDTAMGGMDADLAYGQLGSDVLYGNRGADTLFGGQESDTLFGGQDGDLLHGNLGDDWLDGNLGADTLFGGQGADLFVFRNPEDGGDVIADFEAGVDRIAVYSPNFGDLATGTLSAANFALDNPTTTNAGFVFNTRTGALSFDADGSGAGAAVTVATLDVRTLSASDITVLAS